VVVIEVRDGELIETVTREARQRGIRNAAIVSLIGAVDEFTVSTMPTHDATKDVVTSYVQPAEMTGSGEITEGAVHVHAVMAVEGDRAVCGHLHNARIGAWFARVYLISAD
jgi:predicted DNA-binding protein with PD1-like motif